MMPIRGSLIFQEKSIPRSDFFSPNIDNEKLKTALNYLFLPNHLHVAHHIQILNPLI